MHLNTHKFIPSAIFIISKKIRFVFTKPMLTFIPTFLYDLCTSTYYPPLQKPHSGLSPPVYFYFPAIVLFKKSIKKNVMKHTVNVLLLCIMFFASALKCKKNPPPLVIDNTEKLPPATQEGKNTCGFLLNGKVWVPKGSSGLNSKMSWYYDATLNGGTFNLRCARYVANENVTTFTIAMNQFNTTGLYKLNNIESRVSIFTNSDVGCMYFWDDTISNHNSFVNVTKFDTQNRIIAGNFEVTHYKPGCDTVRITQGRFDVKY